jgi:internalin A
MNGPTSLGRRFLTFDPGVIERFGDPFQPLEPECRVIQFDERLTPSQLERAGRLVADRPDVQLYVYGRVWQDLSFLKYFRTVQRLHIALYELRDAEGIANLPWLRELTFGETRKKFSLRFLEAWPLLGNLFLVGHKTDLSCIRGLTALEHLGLSGYTLPDLSLLLPLVKLREFQLFLGGTRNLAALAQLPALEDLRLMRITKLSDLGILADLAGLKTLHLDWMRNVTSLPSLHRNDRLEDVTLETMKGLTDLSSIAAAPALRRLVVAEMPQLTVESFRCFIGNPRLEELWADTGRRKLNAQVKEMLPGVVRKFPNQL